jgi:DNA-binding IclR family transcriptional regulator
MASRNETRYNVPINEVEEKTKYHVPALEKGLDILEFLSSAGAPQAQTEIARALNKNISELFRMLDCLEQRGYLVRDDANRYQLSLKLFELAHTHSPVDLLLRVAAEPMRELARRFRASVHIGILQDFQLFILAQEESPEPIRISVEVGKKFPAIKTASGRLMLAFLAAEELEQFFKQDPYYRGLSKKQQQHFQKQIERARASHYVIAESDIIEGVQDISVLVGNPELAVVAALAVPVLVTKGHKVDVLPMLSHLQKGAELITQKLGLR